MHKLSLGAGKYTVKLMEFGGAALSDGLAPASAAAVAAAPTVLAPAFPYCAPEVCALLPWAWRQLAAGCGFCAVAAVFSGEFRK